METTDAIRARKSVRNYSGGLTGPQSEALAQAIAASGSPFGGAYTMCLAHFDKEGPEKPGTYGVIRGATDYLLMAVDTGDEASQLGAGYAMEQVVLAATAMGLGTCWIGGTFKGGDFNRGRSWPAGQSLKIISPVGEPSGRKSLLERVAHAALRSGARKAFGKLFSAGRFGTPLAEDSTFGRALEMMRLAPSSTNSQPWRALEQNGTVHFYSATDNAYSLTDMGIGLCHFVGVEQQYGHDGRFAREAAAPQEAGLRYITSYRRI